MTRDEFDSAQLRHVLAQPAPTPATGCFFLVAVGGSAVTALIVLGAVTASHWLGAALASLTHL